MKRLAEMGDLRISKRKKSDEKEYEVEKIVFHYEDEEGRFNYCVKWKDFPERKNTIEKLENLKSCHLALLEYLEQEQPKDEEVIALRTKLESEADFIDTTNQILMLLKAGISNETIEQHLKTYSILDQYRKLLHVTLIEVEDLISQTKEDLNYILRCHLSMPKPDPGFLIRAKQYIFLEKLYITRKQQLDDMKKRCDEINRKEKCYLGIENKLDLQWFPEMNYIVESLAGKGVVIPEDPPIGCECKNCSSKSKCCNDAFGSEFAYYTSEKRLRINDHVPIYECNKNCSCDENCANRVVQCGRQIEICIFKTEKCGWGVKTLQDIKKGSFVCEYIGEIILEEESVVRDVEYVKKNISFIFDLDFNPEENNLYCIDATYSGNVARFLNHSCEPNLIVYPVWVNCLDPNYHRIAFFSNRDIDEGEELTFDYNRNGCSPSSQMISKMACLCVSPVCRGWLFFG